MNIVPLFPKLHPVLDLFTPFVIYGIWRWVVPSIRLTDPRQRCRLLWWFVLFPMVSSVWIGIQPGVHESLLHSVSIGFGVINSHFLGHPGPFCHPPAQFKRRTLELLPTPLLLFVGLRLSGAVFACVGALFDYVRASRIIRHLPRKLDGDIWILDMPGWIAFTFGLVRPRIYVSRQVWHSEHREAVVAHERAHAKRRDPLLRFLLHGLRRLFWYFPYWTSLLVQGEFEVERVCDSQGCATVGRLRYARALLAFLEQKQDEAGAIRNLAFVPQFSAEAEYDMLARAQALWHPVCDYTPTRFWFWFIPIYFLINIIA